MTGTAVGTGTTGTTGTAAGTSGGRTSAAAVGENRHQLFKVFTLALRTLGFAASHDKRFEFLATGTTDKIK
jgi:hypothetical protein